MATKNFVFLSMPRTGSSMVVRMLRTHPDIMCLPSIFTDKGWTDWSHRYPATNSKMIQRLIQLDSKWDDVDYRIANMDELLKQLRELNKDMKAFGFKQHFGSPGRETTEKIVALNLPTVILNRSNILACYSSNKIAKKTGQGALIDRSKRKRAKVEFDTDTFERFLNRRRKIDDYWKDALKKTGVPTMTLEYTEARTIAGMERIAEFLEQTPGQFGEWGTVKRNSNNIVSRFLNPDVAQAYLEEHELTDWITEE